MLVEFDAADMRGVFLSFPQVRGAGRAKTSPCPFPRKDSEMSFPQAPGRVQPSRWHAPRPGPSRAATGNRGQRGGGRARERWPAGFMSEIIRKACEGIKEDALSDAAVKAGVGMEPGG